MADVVLVHGLWYRAWSMRVLARRMANRGYAVHCFSYPTRKTDIARNASDLAAYCREIDGRELHFVAHSLGGLVTLAMLGADHDLPPGRIVLLGTPLRGSAVARRSRNLPGGEFLLGRSAEALGRGYEGVLDSRETGMIAGTRPHGAGRFTGGLSGPSDGTVSVAETRHGGLQDHLELPVTHTGMLVSAAVAGQAAEFLRTGQFSRPA